MHEVAWVYRPVKVESGRKGTLRVTNRQSFVGLEAFDARWTLLVDGAAVKTGKLKLPKLGTARNWNTVTKLAAALREA